MGAKQPCPLKVRGTSFKLLTRYDQAYKQTWPTMFQPVEKKISDPWSQSSQFNTGLPNQFNQEINHY